jgi:hypothetical protein
MNARTLVSVGLISSALFATCFFGSWWYVHNAVTKNFAAPAERVDVSRASMVLAVRSIGRLESYQMELEKIVEAGTWGGNILERAWYTDRLLIIARGEVIAGFDLKNISGESFSETSSTVTVRLGKPEVLISRLNNKETRVHQRDVGFFNSPDPHLESRVRHQAELALVKTACAQGILDLAGIAAQTRVAKLLGQALHKYGDHRQINVLYDQTTC